MTTLSKSIKIKISISIIWGLLATLIAGAAAQDYSSFKFSSFIGLLTALNLPLLCYWLGFWIWGNGYILNFLKRLKKPIAFILAVFSFAAGWWIIKVSQGILDASLTDASERSLRNIEASFNIAGIILATVLAVWVFRKMSGIKEDISVDKDRIKGENTLQTYMKSKKAACIITALSFIIILYTSLSYYKNAMTGLAFEFGFIMGTSLWLYLLAALLDKYVLGKFGYKAFSIFSILLFAFTSYHAYGLISEKQKAVQAVDAIVEAVETDVANVLNEEEGAHKAIKGDYGKFSPIVGVINSSRNKMALLQKVLVNELNKYGDDIFSHETLSDLKKIKALKDELFRSIAVINTLPKKYVELMDGIEEEALKANMDSQIKNEFLDSFRLSRPRKEKAYIAYLKVESEILKKMAEMLSFYELRQGAFAITKEGPVFDKTTDVDLYNKHALELKELAVLEGEIRNRIVNDSLNYISKLKNIEK